MCLVNRPCFLNCEYQLFGTHQDPAVDHPLRPVENGGVLLYRPSTNPYHITKISLLSIYLPTYLSIYLSTYLSIYTNHYKSLHLLSHFFPLHPHLNLSKITVRFAWLNPPVFGALQLQYLLQPPLTSSIYPLVI